MEFQTKRLKIREFRESDSGEVANLLNNLNVTEWLLVFPYPFKIEDANKTVAHMMKRAVENPRTSYNLALELKETSELIGNIGLVKIDLQQKTAMVMYWLGEKFWRKGFGSEALKTILEFGFKELNLRKISADVYPGNEASQKLLEKFGAKKEGCMRKAIICIADGKIKDTFYYGLLREEFIENDS